MDADGRIIPLMEDDQGEEVKDLIDKVTEIEKKHNERMNCGMTWHQWVVEHGNGDDDCEPTLSDLSFFADIIDRLDRLDAQFKLIFDGHVLIDGRWRKITP